MTPNQTRSLQGIKAGVTCWNNAISGVDTEADIHPTCTVRPSDRVPHIRIGFSHERHRP
ncbi:hypothetical protein H4V99_003372 [Cryobacterium sp. CG_9.6]|nr:hypothetical protein [Cryobacterium sp. CG_9.6]